MKTHGTVNWVKVTNADEGADAAFFAVSPTVGGQAEIFFIWFTAALPQTPSVTQRLLWMSHLALVRDALIAKLPISVYHDDTSGSVRSIELDAM